MKPAMIATLTALAFSLTVTTSGLAAQKSKIHVYRCTPTHDITRSGSGSGNSGMSGASSKAGTGTSWRTARGLNTTLGEGNYEYVATMRTVTENSSKHSRNAERGATWACDGLLPPYGR
ncbi:MAG TPA: hypothetical protein VLV86_12440 [Vicinamibacterales bacterium]|nr:hypothetical protein [Vicinamibacterales bacterium]